ncbi:MAG TPA: hypothetical protein ACFYD4_16270 [Candidatus Wunengus sp. YC61]|uniref:hypothetical protein n=1 Tax=Candidatus Wunengus sp. YC61 TaxID=3367698 RepID=UPI004028FCA1
MNNEDATPFVSNLAEKKLKNLAIFFIFDLILPQVEKRISYQFIYNKEKKNE